MFVGHDRLLVLIFSWKMHFDLFIISSKTSRKKTLKKDLDLMHIYIIEFQNIAFGLYSEKIVS